MITTETSLNRREFTSGAIKAAACGGAMAAVGGLLGAATASQSIVSPTTLPLVYPSHHAFGDEGNDGRRTVFADEYPKAHAEFKHLLAVFGLAGVVRWRFEVGEKAYDFCNGTRVHKDTLVVFQHRDFPKAGRHRWARSVPVDGCVTPEQDVRAANYIRKDLSREFMLFSHRVNGFSERIRGEVSAGRNDTFLTSEESRLLWEAKRPFWLANFGGTVA